MSSNVFRTAATLVFALLLSACASTPDGVMMMATSDAPNIETGAGCGQFGVEENQAFAVPAEAVRFDVEFVQPWDIAEKCPTNASTDTVWGCYHEDQGKAYVVGRDWKVYWHEWCHAKFGPAHTRAIASNGRDTHGYMKYIASAGQPVTAAP